MPIDYPPQILKLADGQTLPAANTTATEGDLIMPHPNDAGGGEIWTAIDVSGTLYWMGREQVVEMTTDNNSTITSSTRYIMQWAPRASRTAFLVSLDGHWDQLAGTTNNNYYVVTVEYMGATIASFSTQNGADDTWKRLAQSIAAVVNFASLDDDTDAAGSRALSFNFALVGGQTLKWGVGCVVREILA